MFRPVLTELGRESEFAGAGDPIPGWIQYSMSYFHYLLREGRSLAPDHFAFYPLIEMHFTTEIPWVLDVGPT
jgi:hypothetical protein